MEAESKKERIITAALQLFSQQGYHKTTVSEIAHQAEVAKGTVYWYFDSKKELFQEILLSGIEKLNQRIEVKAMSDQPEIEKLDQIIQLFLEFFANSQEISKMYQENAVSIGAEFKQKLISLRREALEAITQVINNCQQEGKIRQNINGEEAANVLIGMISVYNPHFCDLEASIHEKKEMIKDLFFNGVKT